MGSKLGTSAHVWPDGTSSYSLCMHPPAQLHDELADGLGLGRRNEVVVAEQRLRLDAAQREQIAQGLEQVNGGVQQQWANEQFMITRRTSSH